MITHETAKKLKEIGFNKETWETMDESYFPTLSELIEACGDRFQELTKMKHTNDSPWSAISYPCEECGWKVMISGYGQTKEEAVADLYIKLHEDKLSN